MTGKLLFVIAPIVMGIISAFLRANELCYVYDRASELPLNPSAVTWVLIAITCVMTLAYIAWALLTKKDRATVEKPARVLPIFSCASALVLLAYGGYELYLYMQSRELTGAIFGVLTLACAVSILIVGIKGIEMRENSIYNTLAAIPTFWACYCLILIFRQRIADPIISHYVYLLLAFVCILLFAYSQCAYAFGKDRLCVAYIAAPMGIYFCVIELLAPIIGDLINPGSVFIRASLQEAAPLLAFALYMPAALWEIMKNKNQLSK